MSNEPYDDDEFGDEDFKDFAPEPWVIEAGLMVVVNGEPRFTQKGLSALRAMLEEDKSSKKPN